MAFENILWRVKKGTASVFEGTKSSVEHRRSTERPRTISRAQLWDSMFVQTNRLRFDLLLLGEDEYYLSDESAEYYPQGEQKYVSFYFSIIHSFRKVKGRIKICSRSLFFDPSDERLPVIKYDFQFINQIESFGGLTLSSSDMFAIHTTQIVEMRANNIIGPYVFKKVIFYSVLLIFTLSGRLSAQIFIELCLPF